MLLLRAVCDIDFLNKNLVLYIFGFVILPITILQSSKSFTQSTIRTNQCRLTKTLKSITGFKRGLRLLTGSQPTWTL